ncbi:MAG: helix-turn-helix domain-containing protein [Desulfosudaceae bacterium]
MAPTRSSFGLYLSRCRQERGLSINYLASELKLGVNLLVAIENEDFSKLPDPVYTRGFLRSYANLVGADREWVVNDYQQARSLLMRMSRSERELIRENHRFWRRLIGTLVVMLVIMFFTVLFLSPNGQSSHQEQGPADNINHRPANLKGSRAVNPAGDRISDSNAVPQDIQDIPDIQDIQDIRLTVITLEETWIKIIIDNEKVKEYTLQPDDRLDMRAENGFNLLIGNAAGVKLFANGVPVKIPGDQGEVVNIEIP